MRIAISPSRLAGSLDAISSKSHVHRLLICAALADRPTRIRLRGISEDIGATIRCLAAMGCEMDVQPGALLVRPLNEKSPPKSVTLDCGESGTTARLLLPLAARLFREFALTGSGSLPGRPFGPLRKALEAAGCALSGDTVPLTGQGQLRPGRFEIAGNVSSQFISGLLFALPLLSGDSEIILTAPLQSQGYVAMTMEALAAFGVKAERTKEGFKVAGGQKFVSPGAVAAEGDWSNAAFFLCMNALGANIAVRGLSATSAQGDREVTDILSRFAAEDGKLRGIRLDASQINDLVPALAVVASVAQGETRIYNAGRLRLKESDRIKTTLAMLLSLGADAEETEDGLVIRGKTRLRGGEVDGAGDHRIVMAAASAVCACEGPVAIRGCEAVNKSYPAFFEDFSSLGGIIDVFTDR